MDQISAACQDFNAVNAGVAQDSRRAVELLHCGLDLIAGDLVRDLEMLKSTGHLALLGEGHRTGRDDALAGNLGRHCLASRHIDLSKNFRAVFVDPPCQFAVHGSENAAGHQDHPFVW